ncbi:MAG: carboxymuconolactone decarboxylase family protein [Betaproteobacteria bacterium]|nr:carboxymuconolactone decarboxylase family protein [Betaproteobacteria bacterium]
MARLLYAEPGAMGPEARKQFDRLGAPLNIFRMLAHADSCFAPVVRLGGAILGKQQLSGKLRELAVLLAMRMESGEYETVQHVPIALALGIDAQQIDAINAGRLDSACFDSVEQSVLRFTAEVVEKVAAAPAILAELRRYLSDREVVELIIAIGFYMMMARVTETTGTDMDAPAGQKVVEAIQRRLAGKPG